MEDTKALEIVTITKLTYVSYIYMLGTHRVNPSVGGEGNRWRRMQNHAEDLAEKE